MKMVTISAAVFLVLVLSCQETYSSPGLAPLAAFKAGLVAGILKSLKLHPFNSSPNQSSYQGTASGDVTFSGSFNHNANPYYGYGQPYWGGGRMKMTGNVNYSGKRRPISSNGGGTRRQSIIGNVTYNANIKPIFSTTVAPVTVAPVFLEPKPTYVAAVHDGPSTTTTSMSNGYNVAEVHAVRSNNGMPYGSGNVNINVANAGSGVGAVIHFNGGRTTISTSEPTATVEVKPTTFDDFSTFSTTSDDSFGPTSNLFSDSLTDTYLPPTDDTFVDYDSFDSVNGFDTTADNEIVPQSDLDFTGTDAQFDGSDYAANDFGENDFAGTDFSTNLGENTDSYVSTDFVTGSTTRAPNSVNIEFSASGSGSITKGNGIRGSGNLDFDSSISTSAITEEPTPITDSFISDSFSDYDTFAEYDSPDFTTDDAASVSNSNTDFTSGNDAGFTSDFRSDSNTDFNSDLTSDYNSDFSDLNTDFSSDFTTDLATDFNTDVTSDYSAGFIDTSVPETIEPLSGNNDFEINTSGYVSGTTNDDLEPSVAVSGTNTKLYDSYIQSNVDAIRALSDIAKTHGDGRPVTIRLRTGHRVRQPSQGSSSLSSSSGGGLLGLFSDGSRYQVSQAPLLYKYSDVIESPDATRPRQHHLFVSASGTGNLNFVEGRNISGGQMRLGNMPSQGKSIPNHVNPRNVARNIQRSELQTVRRNNNSARTQSRSRPRPAKRVRTSLLNTSRPMPQRSNAPNARRSNRQQNLNIRRRVASRSSQRGQSNRNSNRNIDAKSISNSRQTQTASDSTNNKVGFSFLGVLAQFAEAHRLSLIKEAQKTSKNSALETRTIQSPRNNPMLRVARHVSSSGVSGRAINTVPIQEQTGVPFSFVHNTRPNYRGMLYESNPIESMGSSHSSTQIENELNKQNFQSVNQAPQSPPNQNPVIQTLNKPAVLLPPIVSVGRGNLGIPSLPPTSPQKPTISSLDRKENSGITRAKLRYRHRQVIPSPRT